jgi:hypothetical protein
LCLNYRIVYKKGIENGAADALPRKPASQEVCYAMSSYQPVWLEQISSSYEVDQFATDVISKLSVDESVVPHFAWAQGLLRYKKRVWVGTDLALQRKLIAAFYKSVVGGHSGVLLHT